MSDFDDFTQCTGVVLDNSCLHDAYWRMHIRIPEITRNARPGQFVHVAVPGNEGHILRRPFSICDVQGETLTVVYKVVGSGTMALKSIGKDAHLNLIGPLGHPFSAMPSDRHAVLLGGGYGCAAMLFAAHRAVEEKMPPPMVLLGARTSRDILLADEFKALGCEVRLATDDGSLGTCGRITVLLEKALEEFPDAHLAACGPRPMLKAVAKVAEMAPRATCEVSLDAIMCCGVGACFGCVVKCKADTSSGWVYKRSCADGPVFPAETIYWE